MRSNQVTKLAAGVFLVSLAIRVTWVAFAHVTPISDFRGYDELAMRWLTTGQFSTVGSLAYRTPGYPGFLAVVYALLGHSWKAAGFIQALIGALTSGLLVMLAAHVLSPRASAVAGALHSISPTGLAYVPVLATETLAAFLVVSGLLCLAAIENREGRGKHGAVAAAGALFGLLMLVRPAAAFLLPACVILSVYSPRRRSWEVRPGLVLIGATALVLSPWLVRNHLAGLGPITLSTAGGVNLWMGNNDLSRLGGFCEDAVWPSTLPEKQKDGAYLRAAGAWVASHPSRYLALSAIRAARLLGTEPDTWAAKYLVPTSENDRAFTTSFLHSWGGLESASPSLIARAGSVEAENAELLRKIRLVIAPLTLAALALSLLWWRDYAIVIFPALSYLAGLSLTYAEIRFRELADPLLFVPLAGLISAVLFRTSEIGDRPPRPSRALAAALAFAKALSPRPRTAHETGPAEVSRDLAEKTQAERRRETSHYKFFPIEFGERSAQGISVWSYPTWSVAIAREHDGVRCEITGSSDPSPGQAGGVLLGVSGLKALRLTVTFLEPRDIRAVEVNGYDSSGQRCLCWSWPVQGENLPPTVRQTYVLVPGKQSWYFVPEGETRADDVQEVHCLLRIAPNSKAGFVLHRAEVAPKTPDAKS